MNIVIVGARERMDSERDKEIVEELIRTLAGTYGRRLNVLSVGCDKGVGKIAREFCIANGIIFVENRMKLEGKDIPRSFFVHVFQGRNPALVALGDEFYVFKGPNENGIVEGIIELAAAKVSVDRVFIYEPGATEPIHPVEDRTFEEMISWCSEQLASRMIVNDGPVRDDFKKMAEQEIGRLVADVKHKLASWLY